MSTSGSDPEGHQLAAVKTQKQAIPATSAADHCWWLQQPAVARARDAAPWRPVSHGKHIHHAFPGSVDHQMHLCFHCIVAAPSVAAIPINLNTAIATVSQTTSPTATISAAVGRAAVHVSVYVSVWLMLLSACGTTAQCGRFPGGFTG
eukprot:CAMPEP_0206141110 /NCGR_PEP_ID=MMETSP1473-20131121/11814_1 /ASSEMBLY_ACC=CAM_ASM_001109 /TAXON_ID=1461547 /ORGANISM="Stichococcus sp, Strain RCC1054" /LENGTH=147 /DNA_ID=CAMNT_0053535525 /DNA_START=128 /DNA_END=572 /DNA_ORIENTATION=-